MLSIPWKQRQATYQFAVIGSGYGGSITASRIAAALGQPHQLCILERGKEWQPGDFPPMSPASSTDAQQRQSARPLRIPQLQGHLRHQRLGPRRNVADQCERRDRPGRRSLQAGRLASHPELRRTCMDYYDRARKVLAASPVPDATDSLKVQALAAARAGDSARTPSRSTSPSTSRIDGPNAQGVVQQPCVDCGDCVTGCNFAAKNTLYMNYLPMARRTPARHLHADQGRVDREARRRRLADPWAARHEPTRQRVASRSTPANVILSAGSLNSTEILLRSEMHGLKVSPALGTRFSGNGDFFGLAYNGDFRDRRPRLRYQREPPRRTIRRSPGPTIVGVDPLQRRRAGGAAHRDRRLLLPERLSCAAPKSAFAAIRGRRHAHRRRSRAARARPRAISIAAAAVRSATAR